MLRLRLFPFYHFNLEYAHDIEAQTHPADDQVRHRQLPHAR
jgi:hypothetical protein